MVLERSPNSTGFSEDVTNFSPSLVTTTGAEGIAMKPHAGEHNPEKSVSHWIAENLNFKYAAKYKKGF